MPAREEVIARIAALGFAGADAGVLADCFLDAEARGKQGHGLVRVAQLESSVDLRPGARPERVVAEPEFERWEGRGAVGYLTLAAICDAQIASPPARVRLVVAADAFPIGALGYWVRRLADHGLLAALTATSPPHLAPPDGGPPLAGTNPLAIAVPSSDGRPLVADVSMARATYGDVLRGAAAPEDVVAFGGDQAHKAFAVALGLQVFVEALAGPEGYGAVLVVARPTADPIPALRARAGQSRLPGDS